MTVLSQQDLAQVVACYRIRLKPAVEASDQVLMQFAVPAPVYAVKEVITAAEFAPVASTSIRQEGELLRVAVLASGANLATDSNWMAQLKPQSDRLSIDPALKDSLEEAADLTLRSDRIVWRSGLALTVCSGDRLDELLIALTYFSYFVSQVSRIEGELSRGWPALREHMALNHQIEGKDLAMQATVNAKTLWATNLRADFASIDPFVDAVPNYMPASAKRMVQELVNHTELLARMRAIDDQLEVFEDTYELANDRLLEFRYYRGEFILETIIILVLLTEIGFMAAEFFW